MVDIDDTSFYQHMAEEERLVRRIKTADNTEESVNKSETGPGPLVPPLTLQRTEGGFEVKGGGRG